MRILVINGPNINLLGTREPEIYGTLTLDTINEELKKYADGLGVEIKTFQSNVEGEIVNALQQAKFGNEPCDGIIMNPAAYTHTSVAIRDAISAVDLPVVEVHLSNIHSREEFRKNSLTAPVCIGQICGFGSKGYKMAMDGLLDYLKK